MHRLSFLKTTAIAILAILPAMLTGCGSEESDDLRIGVILPTSGPLAAYGTSTLEGIRMKVEELNQAGGGRHIELIVQNNEGETTKSADALRKLVGLNKVLAIIGPITSTNSLAIVRDAESKGIVLITPTGTNDAITRYGEFIFRACFIDSFQGVAMAKFAREDLKIDSAVAFKDTASDYSVGLCKSFAKEFSALGGKIPPTPLSYKGSDTDFTPQLRQIREIGAGAVFVPGYPPTLPLIVNQIRDLGLNVVLLGSDGWDNDDLRKNAAENLDGTYFSAAFSTEMASPELEAFLTLARARDIEDPGSFEALGYDSVGLIAQAARLAESKGEAKTLRDKRDALREALASIRDYTGATGKISMRPSGDPLKALVVLRYDKAEDGTVAKTFVKAVSP